MSNTLDSNRDLIERIAYQLKYSNKPLSSSEDLQTAQTAVQCITILEKIKQTRPLSFSEHFQLKACHYVLKLLREQYKKGKTNEGQESNQTTSTTPKRPLGDSN